MLKKMSIKKLIISGIVLFSVFLICLMPSKENEKIEIKQELEYVDKDINTHNIFLLDSDNYLVQTDIVISETKDIEKKAKELLTALIEGSSLEDKIPSGFKSIINSETKILSLKYNEGLIKVDFSKELMDTNVELEEKTIEAIVFTLTSIEDVKSVIIYMNGEILTKLPQSKINLPSTLDRSFGINKQYNINSDKNITKTTVYYIDKINDNTYYVPVTKVNNDNREKIEIIVDELSSSNLYKTNLMSYLNNNTKVLSVNEDEEKMVIEFNSYIFNDIDTKDILEEVIYTICLSINDNYNVKEVVFNVDNKEIYKTVLKSIE